ncbi:DUF1223 domain-containing protein [Microbulbifer hainanensis]|uniref:DUF1223 domain-containing protein n=1 Tax=Microbulbifer hainanensis TaxID=2735675 RepID=UPI0018666A27|nr:DUF1223 domain-containing protein [Microbulbifer hainanensis]
MKWILIPILSAMPLFALGQEWHSGPDKVALVELYTSEGCSSCPPAERWLSSLKDKPGLFSEFVPVAFHVDYWDHIGWKDPFSDKAYSARQRRYVREKAASQVYTPGFIIDGQEWRGWFRGQRQWKDPDKESGVLNAKLQGDQLTVTFTQKQPATLNVAFLGMGISQQVDAGENRGRKLVHDFVVLDLVSEGGEGEWTLQLPPVPDAGQERTALAIWVSSPGSQQVLQTVGGYLLAGN